MSESDLPRQTRRLLVIIPREQAIEHVPLMKHFAGQAEVIIDRRVADRRRSAVDEWPEARCRRREERRSGHVSGPGCALVFAR